MTGTSNVNTQCNLSEANCNFNVNGDVGVSTSNAHNSIDEQKKWYVLRTTYGREAKACHYIRSHGGIVFLPTATTVTTLNGIRKRQTVSLIKNLLFMFGTFEEVTRYVYDNKNLPYLRFYYSYNTSSKSITKEPLVVPDKQMSFFQQIYNSDSDTIITCQAVRNFTNGQHVRIIDGEFKGLEGIVSRWRGQQRVGIIFDKCVTFVTAYIPNAFLQLTN